MQQERLVRRFLGQRTDVPPVGGPQQGRHLASARQLRVPHCQDAFALAPFHLGFSKNNIDSRREDHKRNTRSDLRVPGVFTSHPQSSATRNNFTVQYDINGGLICGLTPNTRITICFYEKYGDPYGTRTRVYAVKGRRPRPLDEGVTGQEVYWSNAGGSRYESKNCHPIGNFFPDTGHIYQSGCSLQRYHSYTVDIKQ